MRIVLFLILLITTAATKQDKVLVCLSGTAYSYHKSYCRGLSECTHAVEKVTIAEALKMKRKPCGYCYTNNALPASNKPATSQCKALTKKGTRCSRSGGASGYCWQHGG